MSHLLYFYLTQLIAADKIIAAAKCLCIFHSAHGILRGAFRNRIDYALIVRGWERLLFAY